MIDLILVLLELFFRGKREDNRGGVGPQRRIHPLAPGTDLEGARPKVDRYGLDHAVPVLVYEVGPDEMIQPAKKRAGDKRRQIEARLEAEAEAREAAETSANATNRPTLPPVSAAMSSNRGGAGNTGAAATSAATQRAPAEALTPVDPPLVATGNAKYPYQFLKQAQVTHHVVAAPGRPIAQVANIDPIQHSERAGRRLAKRSEVANMLMNPKTLVQLLQAQAILEPPPALRPPRG